MLNQTVYETDFCIIGGGLSGTIAALAAARKGAKVVLIQDRPVLGGNSSSEIRMWVRGARGYCNKETGILAEFEEENIYRNSTLSPSLWDSVLYGKIKENENITLLLNASCMDAETKDGKIVSVTAWQLTTYTYCKVYAGLFADCSGDSILAFLTDAKHRIGREGHAEFGERIGPETADEKTMGMSILLQARETDRKVSFVPPEWANVYETDEAFSPFIRTETQNGTEIKPEARDHQIGTSGGNLWWMELGGEGPAIENTERTRDELLKIAFGVWDHIKNRGEHGCDNWELEWVGFLPGKRESVRYIGDIVLTQNDIEENRRFDDAVAYGGWPMDDHNPGGIKADSPSVMYPAPSPYEIPYRCLYSVNIDNLFFAGRNISATHAAMSSTRVMGTCSLLGQAIGNAAAICVKENLLPRDIITGGRISALQREIQNDGVMLPSLLRRVSPLTESAHLNISDEERSILFDGIERPRVEGDRHYIELQKGESITFTFDKEEYVDTLRMLFDPDYSRLSVSENKKMRVFAQKLHRGLDFKPVKVPNTLVKHFSVWADGKLISEEQNNYYSLRTVPLRVKAKKIEIVFHATNGSPTVRLFACDFI